MYPDKLLSHHFWGPSLRDVVEVASQEEKKKSLLSLLQQVQAAEKRDDQCGDVRLMIEHVCEVEIKVKEPCV